jgi:hypothetical protein
VTSAKLGLTLVAAVLVAAPSAGGLGVGSRAGGLSVTVADFNLGLVEIPQPGGTGRFAVFPTELKGVIGMPAGTARRPIVVILHGRHGTGCPEMDEVEEWPCPAVERRNDFGFRYLVRSLAMRSFVALSINVNGADTNGWGEPDQARADRILGQILRRLATANDGGANGFGVPVAGRVDFSRLGLIGHSQRGGRVVAIARNRAAHPGPVAQGRGRVRAALLVAPVAGGGAVPRRTAFSMIVPECDNDVRSLDGVGYFDAAGAPRRQRPAALVYLRRANHNFFNSRLADEGGHDRPGCVRRPERLSRAIQTAWLARYAPALFRSTLFGLRPSVSAGLDPAARAPLRIFRRRVLSSLGIPRADRLVLRHSRNTGAVTVESCRRGRPCRPGLWQPAYPRQLLVGWARSWQVFEAAADRPRDVRSFDAVRLRVAVDPTSPRNRLGRPQQFSLVLTDARGRTAVVRVPRTAPAVAFPRGRFSPGTEPLSYVITSDVRVPLERFRGVNLRRLVSVALRFDGTKSGSILLTEVQLVRRRAD